MKEFDVEEMKKTFEESTAAYTEMSKGALDATRELVEISGRFMGKALENQIEFANLVVDTYAKQLDVAKDSVDPQTFVENETAFVEAATEKFTVVAKTNVALAEETGEELKTWFEKGVKTADETVKEVVSKSTPKKAPVKKAVAKKAPVKKAA